MRKRYFIDDGGEQMYGPFTKDRAIHLANHMLGWRCVWELEGVDMFGLVRTWGEVKVAS